jgi:hypothetical protein
MRFGARLALVGMKVIRHAAIEAVRGGLLDKVKRFDAATLNRE